MKALKITKPGSRSSMWYANLVGCVVPLVGTISYEYVSREVAGYINFVQLGDAEVIEVDAGVEFYKPIKT